MQKVNKGLSTGITLYTHLQRYFYTVKMYYVCLKTMNHDFLEKISEAHIDAHAI